MFRNKIVRFLISGGSAAGTEYLTFLLMVGLWHIPLLVANTVSFLCGFVVSFALNRSWVFGSKGRVKKQLMLYTLLAGVNLVLSNAIVWLAVEMGILSAIAKVFAMVMIAVWNYAIFSKIIFRQK